MREEDDLQIGRRIDFPKVADERGNLTYIEQNEHVPFDIERVYYLYDVPGGESRGGHAHRELEQVIIAANGSFDLILDDAEQRERVNLNRSYYGIYMPPGVWRELENFSSGSVCLVLASRKYDEDDYVRGYRNFIHYSNSQ
ncbi:sugar 3,4-ketoisomerase [Halorubrum salinum]|uniref:sugar 3,4-ketoisomerase n=1 Tax=Halorubrum salinum TaxID=767517 RepID=UPI0021131A81|nr:FdtA/QdtA family cupin domain-containing protein [Halorubrum salinum]